MKRLLLPTLIAFAAGAALLAQTPKSGTPAPTDLDNLMARALAHRDSNWKKLNQFVLDEHEAAEVHGPNGALLLGEQRDYAWFAKDGFFVRSPVRANDVTVPETERVAYERQWLTREQQRLAARDAARAGRGATPDTGGQTTPDTLGAVIERSREPGFVSTGYFLEFDFEPGNYYLAARETLAGRPVLRIEYYPTSLFDARRNRRMQNRDQDQNGRQQELRRQMNKTALITLWVDPASSEILKYTFDNLGLDFFPGGWLARFDDMQATVDMTEPFAGVWLPGRVDVRLSFTMATGAYDLHYRLTYSGYKEAVSKATIIPRSALP